MRFRLIEDQRDAWPVRVMCDALSFGSFAEIDLYHGDAELGG